MPVDGLECFTPRELLSSHAVVLLSPAFSSVTTVHNNTTPSAGAAAMFSPLPTPVLPSVVVPTVADSMFMSGCMTPLSAPPAQEGTALHTLGRNSRHPKKVSEQLHWLCSSDCYGWSFVLCVCALSVCARVCVLEFGACVSNRPDRGVTILRGCLWMLQPNKGKRPCSHVRRRRRRPRRVN